MGCCLKRGFVSPEWQLTGTGSTGTTRMTITSLSIHRVTHSTSNLKHNSVSVRTVTVPVRVVLQRTSATGSLSLVVPC